MTIHYDDFQKMYKVQRIVWINEMFSISIMIVGPSKGIQLNQNDNVLLNI